MCARHVLYHWVISLVQKFFFTFLFSL
jgi:hypothetical protein